ncbi:CPBP family intramembrane glutamic endopeptidase [Agromyces sp. NPDC056965]|uniref:CPBP family intramembrane glutamic endopeptidase n=1 Tax=Agromyces sp. NPDC056965 TaxID=3345983 RepID=UPI00362C24E3
MTTTTPKLTRVRTDLLLFALLTALISGSLWLLLAWQDGNVREGAALWIFGIATSGPSLAALILFLSRTRGSPERAARPRLGSPWLWAPAALVLGAAPVVIANLVLVPQEFGARLAEAPAVVAGFGGPLLFVVLFMIAGPIAEEFGWRGFAQPRLRRSLGIIATSVVLGIAWAIWHLPLFFLPGTGQAAMGLFTVDGLLFCLSLIPLSLVYLFVSERLGGGVWAAILIHFSGNAVGSFFPEASVPVAVAQLLITCLLAAALFFSWHPEARRARG